MKLAKIIDCQQVMKGLFAKQLPFTLAEKLCDLMPEVDRQLTKYADLFNRLIAQHGTKSAEDGHFTFKGEHQEAYLRELEQLNSLDFSPEKQLVPKPKQVTPRELSYLREFFIFEDCEDI